MKNTWLSLLGLLALLLPFPQQSLADWGERFLAVRCDAEVGVFEAEPRIIWNEELSDLRPYIENEEGRTQREDYELFHFKRVDRKVDASCKISGAELRALVSDSELQIFENNAAVASVRIDDVWHFYGYIFKVRYTLARGWEEICGREESQNNWRALDRKRTDTNCREPLKEAPNK